jgi:hypothetical protein
LINLLHRDEGRASTPNEGSQCPLFDSSIIDRELEKVNFPKFWGAMDSLATKAWLKIMVMCFTLHDCTYNMKVYMEVFQLKGSVILWWNTLLPELSMVIENVS